jgi:hypothetical protein
MSEGKFDIEVSSVGFLGCGAMASALIKGKFRAEITTAAILDKAQDKSQVFYCTYQFFHMYTQTQVLWGLSKSRSRVSPPVINSKPNWTSTKFPLFLLPVNLVLLSEIKYTTPTHFIQVLFITMYGVARRTAKELPGIFCTTSNVEVVKRSKVLILAVKPHVVESILREISSVFTQDHLLISICAGSYPIRPLIYHTAPYKHPSRLFSLLDLPFFLGITNATMMSSLPAGSRVVRVMPNTPALVSAGASAYALGELCALCSVDGGKIDCVSVCLG